VLVLVVARVARDFEGAVVAVDAAAIFRWARALASKAYGALGVARIGSDLLHEDLVPPGVTHVVLLGNASPSSFDAVLANTPFVLHVDPPFGIADRVDDASRREGVVVVSSSSPWPSE
jgi:hypothetical protein